MTFKQLVDEKAAAEFLSVSVQTLRNDRARAGKRRFPYIKLGKSIRYDITDLRAIVRENRIPASSEAE